MIKEKIELLDVNLLNEDSKIKDIDHWLEVFNWPNGWHYDLDIIWVLKCIEESKLPKGSTIIDAGAGLGMTQFILASYGFNVISLDFTDRQIPKYSKKIFNIVKSDENFGDFTHEYMEFMTYGQDNGSKEKTRRKLFPLVRKLLNPARFGMNMYKATYLLKQRLNFSYLIETMKKHDNFGKITFLRGAFNKIPLKNNTADALVSVSAFEHNTYEDMPGSVKEFLRVVKKDSPLIITTSASEKEDWYFKPPKAWNFSSKTLSSWFNIAEDKVEYDYRKVFENITNSKLLESRISPFYKFTGNNGLPYGNIKEIKYLPVGIVKIKE